MSYVGTKDLNREAELKTLPGVGSTVPVGRVTFSNEALRQFLKAFNDRILPSIVAKRWLAIRQIFTVTAGASEPDQPGQFARQHSHPNHGSSAHRTFQRITIHGSQKPHISCRAASKPVWVRTHACLKSQRNQAELWCGVQISDGWMSGHHQASEKASDRSAEHQTAQRFRVPATVLEST